MRGELLRELVRQPLFIVGVLILSFWIICAIFGNLIAPYSPYAQNLLGINKPPSSAHWFGTDSLGRDMFSRVIVGSRDIMVIAPLATLLGTVLGTAIGLVMGYFRGLARRRDQPLRRGDSGAAAGDHRAGRDRRARPVERDADRRDRIGVHSTDRAHRARRGAAGTRARLRRRRPPARRARPLHHVRRDPAQRALPGRGGVHGPARLRDLHRRDAVVPRLRHPAAVTRLGTGDRLQLRVRDVRVTGGRCCSTRSRSPHS